MIAVLWLHPLLRVWFLIFLGDKMRAIALCLLVLCLSACTDDTKYDQGYADAMKNKTAYQNEMEQVKTAVVLCQSKMNFYPKFFLNCDALSSPELVKKSNGFGVSKSYWFLAVQLPVCLIALFSLAALALLFNFIIKFSKIRLEKNNIQANISKKLTLQFSEDLKNIQKEHQKAISNAENNALERFKASDEYIPYRQPKTLLKNDSDENLAILLKKAQAEHPDFEF